MALLGLGFSPIELTYRGRGAGSDVYTGERMDAGDLGVLEHWCLK